MKMGLAKSDRAQLLERKKRQKVALFQLLRTRRCTQQELPQLRLSHDDRPTLEVWLRRPEASLQQIREWLQVHLGEELPLGVLATVETEVKYEGYMRQQEVQVKRLRQAESRRIPTSLDYSNVPGLSREIREKLEKVRPETIGQASRIPGVTPAAVAVLDIYLNFQGT
jgi:NAD/FAD-utilizing enzyme apparently involved in cell division